MKKWLLLLLFFLTISAIGQVNPDGTVKTPPDVPDRTPKPQSQTRNTSGSIGIGIDIGGLIRSIKRNKNCNQVDIVFPSNKSKFIADKAIAPTFRWKSSKPDLVVGYTIELGQVIDKEKIILYQGETAGNQFKWPEDIPWQGEQAGKIRYEFYVMGLVSNSEKCGNDVVGIEFTVTTENPVLASTQKENETKKTTGFEAEYSGITDKNNSNNQNGCFVQIGIHYQ